MSQFASHQPASVFAIAVSECVRTTLDWNAAARRNDLDSSEFFVWLAESLSAASKLTAAAHNMP